LFIFKLIRRVISFVLLLVIVIPLYVAGSIWYTAKNSKPEKSDVILVMGAAQFDGRPSEILLARLTEAKTVFKTGFAPRIYTVGGGAPGDRTTEAASSKAWLTQNGVNKSKVIAITKGRDTLSSTKAYVEQMKKAKFRFSVNCYRSLSLLPRT
jgi:vancomycin permeability regulator SanA